MKYARPDTGVFLSVEHIPDRRHPVLCYGKGNEAVVIGYLRNEAALIKFCATLEHLLGVVRNEDGSVRPEREEINESQGDI